MADKLFSDYVCITYWNLKQTILFDFKIVQSEYVLITTERGLISARGGENVTRASLNSTFLFHFNCISV